MQFCTKYCTYSYRVLRTPYPVHYSLHARWRRGPYPKQRTRAARPDPAENSSGPVTKPDPDPALPYIAPVSVRSKPNPVKRRQGRVHTQPRASSQLPDYFRPGGSALHFFFFFFFLSCSCGWSVVDRAGDEKRGD